ncbi:MAG: STAS domain-containing protein [Myxococcota bacterium]
MSDDVIFYSMPGPSVVQDEDVRALSAALAELVPGSRASAKIAIDCSQTHYVSSRVLGLLVSFCTDITDAGGRVVLYGVTPATERVLNVTRLSTLLTVVENEEEARNRLAHDEVGRLPRR